MEYKFKNEIPIEASASDPETQVDLQRNTMLCIIQSKKKNLKRIEFKRVSISESFGFDLVIEDSPQKEFYLKKVIPIKVKQSKLFACIGIEYSITEKTVNAKVQIGSVIDNQLDAHACSFSIEPKYNVKVERCRAFMEQNSLGDLIFSVASSPDLFLIKSADIQSSMEVKDKWNLKAIRTRISNAAQLQAMTVGTHRDTPGVFVIYLEQDSNGVVVGGSSIRHYQFKKKAESGELNWIFKMMLPMTLIDPSLSVCVEMLVVSSMHPDSFEYQINGIRYIDDESQLWKIEIGKAPIKVINLIWMDKHANQFAILKQDPHIINDKYLIEIYCKSGVLSNYSLFLFKSFLVLVSCCKTFLRICSL